MKTRYLIMFLFLSICVIAQCSIKAPELQVTGEKTALENQVLGTYEQIESDGWLIASTRAFGTKSSTEVSDTKQAVLEAVQNRKFNQDDVSELKHDKVIGENNKGFLHILGNNRYENDVSYRKLVDQIVEEENRDRQIIFDRVLSVNLSAAEAGKDRILEIFAKLNYDNSEAGTMVQTADGQWIEKPNPSE